MFQVLKGFALLGGQWVLVVLVLLSLWALKVAIERWMFFGTREKRALELNAQLPALLVAGKIVEAKNLCNQSVCPEGAVVGAGLEHLPLGIEAVEQIMESKRLEERLALDRHLLILGTLGNNIPFVGLFGTVLGIIKAFNDLAISGTAGPTVVMNGVAEALVSTALGLLIAIPVVAAFNFFQEKVRRILLNADRLSRLMLAHSKMLGDARPGAVGLDRPGAVGR